MVADQAVGVASNGAQAVGSTSVDAERMEIEVRNRCEPIRLGRQHQTLAWTRGGRAEFANDRSPLSERLLCGDTLGENGGEEFVVRNETSAEPKR